MMKHIGWISLIITGLLSLLACRPEQPAATAGATSRPITETMEESMSVEKPFELTYVAQGGQPRVDARLQIAAGGQAELYLGSTWSLPAGGLDKVGLFAGQIPPDKLTTLNNYLAQHNLMSRSGGATPTSPDPATRYLTLKQNGQETSLRLTDTSQDPVMAGLEEMLAGLMADLTAHPRQAVQVTLAAPVAGGNIQPAVTMTNIGTESLPILLVDPADPNFTMVAQLLLEKGVKLPSGSVIWMGAGGTTVPREEIVALADAGSLPRGVQAMPAGQVYRFSLPPLAAPTGDDVHVSGVFNFWWPGTGPERRLLSVQTPRQPLKGQ